MAEHTHYIVTEYLNWRDGNKSISHEFYDYADAISSVNSIWAKNNYFVEESEGFTPKVHKVTITRVITTTQYETVYEKEKN